MAAPNEITVPRLLRLIGTPDTPQIVDGSIDPDFEADPYLIPGAIRHPHRDAPGLTARIEGQRSVIVCQRGIKLSQGMTSLLRSDGIHAEYLKRGNHGWRDHPGAPRIAARAHPKPIAGRTLWATRHRPRIDPIACPWLIRRFVDRNAAFLFVSPAEIMGVAQRYGAVPFNVKDTFWTHLVDTCTFDTMLDEFALRTEAPDRLSSVIRAADTDTHAASPQAAGLLALSVGLLRQYRDDHAQPEVGLTMYDALYRWAGDGDDEEHDWPAGAAR